MKVFVIEDNDAVRKTVSKPFADMGYEVFEFPDIQKSLGKIGEKPDIIILDHFFPQLNGIDCIPIYREFSPKSFIVVYSSQRDIKVLDDAFKFGADLYLHKSEVPVNQIFEKISPLLKKHEEKNWFRKYWSDFWKSNTRKNKIIGMVEDNEVTSFTIQKLIQNLSSEISVYPFSNIKEFTDSFGQIPYDMVILDYDLGNGQNCTSALVEARQKYPNLFVIIFSGQQDVKVALDLLEKGASVYLLKSPDNTKRLISIIEEQYKV